MKKIIFLMMYFFINNQLAFSKNHSPDTAKIHTVFLVISYSKPPVITANLFVSTADWEYIHILHGSQYDEILKYLKATSIGIVQIKHDIKLITLYDILKKYHIPQKYWHTKVGYDDEAIEFPETLVATSNQITSVKIVYTHKGYFIDIIGADYGRIKEMKEAKKRGEPFVD